MIHLKWRRKRWNSDRHKEARQETVFNRCRIVFLSLFTSSSSHQETITCRPSDTLIISDDDDDEEYQKVSRVERVPVSLTTAVGLRMWIFERNRTHVSVVVGLTQGKKDVEHVSDEDTETEPERLLSLSLHSVEACLCGSKKKILSNMSWRRLVES